jgi:hypothetical protein
MVNASLYMPNRVQHKDLNIPLVVDLASTRYKSFHPFLQLHTNSLVQALALSPYLEITPSVKQALAKGFPT